MSELGREELLETFEEMWKSATIGDTWKLNKKAKQVHEQIKALIKALFNLKNKSLMKLAEDLGVSFSAAKIISDHAQPRVTEEWIEEKAERFLLSFPGTYTYQYQGQLKYVKDFICSLYEEIQCEK